MHSGNNFFKECESEVLARRKGIERVESLASPKNGRMSASSSGLCLAVRLEFKIKFDIQLSM